jgi:NAD(P)H-flavin reductase
MPSTDATAGFEIVRREDLSEVTYLLAVRHPMMARAARPGQFAIVMSHPEGERIPLTLADFDAAEGTITLVVQAVGKSTREMQQNCQVGGRLHALVGPMGLPTQVGDAKKVVCVGGGLGVAPLYPQARAFHQKGATVIGIIGFRSAGLMFWEDRFRAVCDEVLVCTDDGSAGMQGFVSDGLRKVITEQPDVDEVVAIGPPVMMRACAETTRPYRIHTVVSLNPIMVDGTGMCGGCRVKLGDAVKFACVDGPDFDGHLVDFDDLTMRLGRYREEEAVAMRRWSESCRLLATPAVS